MSRKTTTPANMPPIVKKEDRYLRCDLTQQEILEKGKLLSEKNVLARQLEEEKKKVTSDFAAKIAGAESEISVLSSTIQCGYEHRTVKCEVKMHTPKGGKKTVTRMDTLDDLPVEDMTQGEMQAELPLEA